MATKAAEGKPLRKKVKENNLIKRAIKAAIKARDTVVKKLVEISGDAEKVIRKVVESAVSKQLIARFKDLILPDDVNVASVIEEIVDGVMEGLEQIFKVLG